MTPGRGRCWATAHRSSWSTSRKSRPGSAAEGSGRPAGRRPRGFLLACTAQGKGFTCAVPTQSSPRSSAPTGPLASVLGGMASVPAPGCPACSGRWRDGDPTRAGSAGGARRGSMARGRRQEVRNHRQQRWRALRRPRARQRRPRLRSPGRGGEDTGDRRTCLREVAGSDSRRRGPTRSWPSAAGWSATLPASAPPSYQRGSSGCPASDHAGGPGRLGLRGQDRGGPAGGKELCRRVPPAGGGYRGHCAACQPPACGRLPRAWRR